MHCHFYRLKIHLFYSPIVFRLETINGLINGLTRSPSGIAHEFTYEVRFSLSDPAETLSQWQIRGFY